MSDPYQPDYDPTADPMLAARQELVSLIQVNPNGTLSINQTAVLDIQPAESADDVLAAIEAQLAEIEAIVFKNPFKALAGLNFIAKRLNNLISSGIEIAIDKLVPVIERIKKHTAQLALATGAQNYYIEFNGISLTIGLNYETGKV